MLNCIVAFVLCVSFLLCVCACMDGLLCFLSIDRFGLGFWSGFCLLRVNWGGGGRLGLCYLFGGGGFVQSYSFVWGLFFSRPTNLLIIDS